MKKVSITKISKMPNGIIDPIGNRGMGPIGNGHRVEGLLYAPIEVGKVAIVLRHKSNQWVGQGLFQTSIVTSISDDGKEFTTQNSKYKVEYPNA